VAFAVVSAAVRVPAKVLLAKDEALALAFPDAERIEERVVILDEAQKAAVEKRAGSKLESQLWTVHVGWRGGTVLGFAIIDSHVVRTLPEAFMVVLEPDGRVRKVEILAFYEPPEYMPAERWVRQFEGRALDGELALRRAIQGITGATLSAVAMTAGVRRALALFEVAVRDAAPTAMPSPAPPS
jgi:hypothetical protein